MKSALNAIGFNDIDILVAETGWPYRGDNNEVGPSVENAKAYNGNLIKHLRSMVGTPLIPGKPVETYIFALYDENLKPGPTSERSFGLFKPDLSATYDAGLSKSSQVINTVNLINFIGILYLCCFIKEHVDYRKLTFFSLQDDDIGTPKMTILRSQSSEKTLNE